MRSMSRWSMIAMSPGPSRCTRSFVRLPEPGGARDLGKRAPASGRRLVPAGEAASGAGCRKPSKPVAGGASTGRILRCFEQSFGMSPGRAVAGVRAQHPAELRHELAPVEPARLGPRPRPSPRLALLDPKVAGRERGDLRQVRDAHDLPPLARALRSLSPTARAVLPPTPASTSSKTTVGAPPARRRDAHQRQHHARELAAGGDLAQPPGRHARLGAIMSSTESAPRGPNRAAAALGAGSRSPSDDLERGLRHRQRRQLRAHRPLELARRLAARSTAASSPGASSSAVRRVELRLEPRGRLLGVRQPLVLGAAALGVREHGGDRATVLSLQPREQLEPLLDLRRAAPGSASSASRSRAARGRAPAPRRRARGRARPARRAAASAPASAPSSRLGAASKQRQRAPPAVAPPRARARCRAQRRWPQRLHARRAARARPRARPPRPRSGAASSISLSSNSSRSRSRSRAPTRSRSSSSSRSMRRARRPGALEAARASRCVAPQKASSTSSWADASVSLRCSCCP